MSVEYMSQTSMAEFVVGAEGVIAPQYLSRSLGRVSIEGFTLMEAVPEPQRYIREALEEGIVDQPLAIEAIMDALDRSEVRLQGDNRPKANLAFLGPTGVGKSETAKILANILGEGEGNLLKIDCSNYSSGHEVANLVGSPAGYVGYGNEPVLSKKKVEKPGTVLLFDEIEKGSAELYNMMLQIMGDGELELSSQGTVSFRDAIIIVTSNLGAREMSSRLYGKELGFVRGGKIADVSHINETAEQSFKQHFQPEFINRFNKLVVFHPLSNEGLGRVLDTKLHAINVEYKKQYGARLSLSDSARGYLVETAAKESHMGARPLVRALEDNVQTIFGRYVSAGHVPEGTHIKVFHRDEVAIHDIATDASLIFTSKRDRRLRKYTPPRHLATLTAANEKGVTEVHTDEESK